MAANPALVDELRDFAAARGITPAHVALGWLLAQRPYVVPIPGGTALEHLDDNLPAAETPLSQDDLAALDVILAAHPVVGAPLSPELAIAIDR